MTFFNFAGLRPYLPTAPLQDQGVYQPQPGQTIGGATSLGFNPPQDQNAQQPSDPALAQYLRTLEERDRRIAEQAAATAKAQRGLGEIQYVEPERKSVSKDKFSQIGVGALALSALLGNKRAGEHAIGLVGAREARFDKEHAQAIAKAKRDYDQKVNKAVADIQADTTLTEAEKDAYLREAQRSAFGIQRGDVAFEQGMQTQRFGLDEKQFNENMRRWDEQSKPDFVRDYNGIKAAFPDIPDVQARAMALGGMISRMDDNAYNRDVRPIQKQIMEKELGLKGKALEQADVDLAVARKNLKWFDRETQAKITSMIVSAYAAKSAAERGNAMFPYDVWQLKYQSYYDTQVKPLLLQLEFTDDPQTLAGEIGKRLSAAPQPNTPVQSGFQGPPSPGLAPFDPNAPKTGRFQGLRP